MTQITSLGELHTMPLDADAADHPTLTGIGQFSLKVNIETDFLNASTSPRKLVSHTIATCLAHCVRQTEAAPHLWYFTCTPLAREILQTPKTFRMKKP